MRAPRACPLVVVQIVGFQEVIDAFWVEVITVFPGVVLRAVALPAHQELSVGRTSTPAHSKDAAHFVLLTPPTFSCVAFCTMYVKEHFTTSSVWTCDLAFFLCFLRSHLRDATRLTYVHYFRLCDRYIHVCVKFRASRDTGHPLRRFGGATIK